MSKLALALAFSLVASSALAHPKLISAAPAPAAQVATPAQIRIVFSEPVFPKFSGVVLHDQHGKAMATGAPSVDPADHKVLIVPLKATLAPGAYHLTWHAVAADTHRVQGEYGFVVK
ncbi:MAG TPA: copper homeostasis periplasmic binding protein CopC [Caulobacteraceae bacterium]|jgi:hypothetical protein|nr:copper homeostasis periplasmic binding protein CopC [Caulobacteraceae bacterium]